jgi:hypothetical protein
MFARVVLQLLHCRYGEAWAPGDIVGCGIDLIKGEVSFWRNGVALGVASAEVAKGPGIAYVLTACFLTFFVNLGFTRCCIPLV